MPTPPPPNPSDDPADASDDADASESINANGAIKAEEASEDLSSFLKAIKAPISDESPAGDSVTYDEDFQTLKTQINNIGSASGKADYERIVELGRTILTEKSKDLRAAGYLVIGEAHAHGTASMAEALQAVYLLIDTYWKDLYPAKRRMRGRGSALQFISDRLSDWVSSTDFEQDDRVPLVAARDYLKAIQEFGMQEMEEHAPAFSGLLNELDDVIGSLPEPESESRAEFSDDTEPERNEAKESSSSTPPPSALNIASGSDASRAVTKVASFLREQDLTDPTPYRLLRAGQWGVLREPPNDGGKPV